MTTDPKSACPACGMTGEHRPECPLWHESRLAAHTEREERIRVPDPTGELGKYPPAPSAASGLAEAIKLCESRYEKRVCEDGMRSVTDDYLAGYADACDTLQIEITALRSHQAPVGAGPVKKPSCDCTKYNGGQCYNCLNGAHDICGNGQGRCNKTPSPQTGGGS